MESLVIHLMDRTQYFIIDLFEFSLFYFKL